MTVTLYIDWRHATEAALAANDFTPFDVPEIDWRSLWDNGTTPVAAALNAIDACLAPGAPMRFNPRFREGLVSA